MLINPYWSMEGIEEIELDGNPARIYRDRPENLDQVLRHTVKRFTLREAIVSERERLTYEAFDEKIDRVASAVKEKLGVEPGDRVAFIMGNHWRWIMTFMAIARVGAISVPLNNRLQGPEIVHQLNNSQTRILILDQEYLGRMQDFRKDLETVREIIVNNPANLAGIIDFRELERFPSRNIVSKRSEEDVLTILYTSGTTGLPKGAMLTNRNVISIVMCLTDVLQCNETDRMLIFVPLFHVTGLVINLLMIIKGGAAVILPSFSRHEVPRIIEEERITMTVAVPATFILMMDSPNYNRYSRATMKAICYGGAPSPPEMHQQLKDGLPKDCILTDTYGLTEASSNVTLMPIRKDREVIFRYGTIGLANPLVDLRVVDDMGKDLPDGEVGELVVRGPTVMKGYWGSPEKTAENIKDGWLFTGDLVTKDKDGFITIKGRKRHMIIRGGENIYPAEIEAVLYTHPDILEAAVAAVPDRVMGEEVKVVIVPKEGVSLNPDQIKEYLKYRVADYKIPKYISFVRELPRNPAGKIMVNMLVDL